MLKTKIHAIKLYTRKEMMNIGFRIMVTLGMGNQWGGIGIGGDNRGRCTLFSRS